MTRTETLHTPGSVTLNLRLPAGRIEISTEETEETHVELVPLRGSRKAREAVEEALVEAHAVGDGWEVVVDVENSLRFGFLEISWSEDILLKISAPNGASVESSTASADVTGRGRFGSLDVKVASGDVSFAEAEGDVRVKTASGDVELGPVGGELELQSASGDVAVDRVEGESNVRSASGDVLLRDARSSVSIKTASGDQRLEAVTQGEVKLQSASGDIFVGVRPGARVWIDAKSMTGDTSSELDVGDAPPEGDEGPAVEISATAMTGDIRIARAAKQPA